MAAVKTQSKDQILIYLSNKIKDNQFTGHLFEELSLLIPIQKLQDMDLDSISTFFFINQQEFYNIVQSYWEKKEHPKFQQNKHNALTQIEQDAQKSGILFEITSVQFRP